MNERKCNGCQFWQPWKQKEALKVSFGNCHRMPPTYSVEFKSTRRGEWPATHAEDSCGEWKESDVPF